MNKFVAVMAVAACAGCASDSEGLGKAVNVLGTAATFALEATQPPPPPPPPQPVVVVQQPVLVQQPVVPVPAPAVQAPAAPQAPAVDVSAFAGVCTAATDTAEPEYKYGTLRFRKPATPEQIAAAKAKIPSAASLSLDFEKVDEATVTAAIAQFPGARRISVRKTGLKTLAPFAALRDATDVKIGDADLRGVSLAPLAGLRKLETFDATYSKIDDLAPLAGLPCLKKVGFYGATLTTFAPLASCPRLEEVYFYAAVLPPEGYASLGLLRQVRRFHGGLTKMTDISWLRQVPQTEEVQIFAEKIPDLTPIQALPNLTYLRLWNMAGGNLSAPVGDLALLANNRKLKRLELPGCRYSNVAALAALQDLERLDLSGAKEPVDVAVVASLPKLKSLDLGGSTVVNGTAIPASVRVGKNSRTQGL